MSTERKDDAYALPALPYGYDALEPHLDEATMRVHHQGHHAGYTSKLNAALESMKKDHADLAAEPIEALLAKLDKLPEAFRAPVANLGGGYVNHCFFWHCMSGDASDPHKPTGALAEAMDAAFGSFDDFKTKFTAAAATVFGSGWAWLVLDKTGDAPKLTIEQSKDQFTPANTPGKVPLLTIDVWEHAYYLKFTKNRPDYIAAWWNVASFKRAEEIYAAAMA